MSARDVARAIDACRRGWPIAIADGDGATLVLLPVETADDDGLESFASGECDLLLTAMRGDALTLEHQPEAASGGAIRITGGGRFDLSAAIALADPAFDLIGPIVGPLRTIPVRGDGDAAFVLARLAGLLPAFFVRERADDIECAVVDAAAIKTYREPQGLRIASRARLPLSYSETCEIVAFRSRDDAAEHVALVIGQPDGSPPLVRLHSECLSGDVFGSLKCDCGPQLDAALRRIASDWGILLYLRQEGRDIGLVNKLRAYALQDQGYDTVDANLRLGLGMDERSFAVAISMLQLLGQPKIRLMTNNPAKITALQRGGIDIVERIPHGVAANPYNSDYLSTKRTRAGHLA